MEGWLSVEASSDGLDVAETPQESDPAAELDKQHPAERDAGEDTAEDHREAKTETAREPGWLLEALEIVRGESDVASVDMAGLCVDHEHQELGSDKATPHLASDLGKPTLPDSTRALRDEVGAVATHNVWKALVVMLLLMILGSSLENRSRLQTSVATACPCYKYEHDRHTLWEPRCQVADAGICTQLHEPNAELVEARSQAEEIGKALARVQEELRLAKLAAEEQKREQLGCTHEREEIIKAARNLVSASETARTSERQAWKRRLQESEERAEGLRLLLERSREGATAAEKARREERWAWQKRVHKQAEEGEGRPHDGRTTGQRTQRSSDRSHHHRRGHDHSWYSRSDLKWPTLRAEMFPWPSSSSCRWRW